MLTGLIIGVFIGGFLGVLVMAMMFVAKGSDNAKEVTHEKDYFMG